MVIDHEVAGFFVLLGALPFFGMAAVVAAQWRHRKPALAWAGPPKRRSAPLRVPEAEETAESVRRFRQAADRAVLLDFVWDHYSKGRALLLDQMRAAAQGRAGRRKRPEIAERL